MLLKRQTLILTLERSKLHRNRWSLGSILKTKPLNLRAEYLAGKDGNVKSEGFMQQQTIMHARTSDIILSYDYLNKKRIWTTNSKTTLRAYNIGSIPNAACKRNIPIVTIIKR